MQLNNIKTIGMCIYLWEIVLNEVLGLRSIPDSLKKTKKKIILQSNNTAHTKLSNFYSTNRIKLLNILNKIKLYKTKLGSLI